MLKICLVFWKSELRYAYKSYAYKKHVCSFGGAERRSMAGIELKA